MEEKIYKYIRYVKDANQEIHIKQVNGPIPKEEMPVIRRRLQFGDTIYTITNVVDFSDHIHVYMRVAGVISKTGGHDNVVPLFKNRKVGLVTKDNYSGD